MSYDIMSYVVIQDHLLVLTKPSAYICDFPVRNNNGYDGAEIKRKQSCTLDSPFAPSYVVFYEHCSDFRCSLRMASQASGSV